MPDVRNCRRCGKVYNYMGGAPICPVCKEKDELDFRRVKDYLWKNPGASMSDVSVALDLSVDKITRYLKEGRLEIISESGNMVLECENCGKSIKTGRFCDECSKGLADDFVSTAKELKKSNEALTHRNDIAMRYLKK